MCAARRDGGRGTWRISRRPRRRVGRRKRRSPHGGDRQLAEGVRRAATKAVTVYRGRVAGRYAGGRAGGQASGRRCREGAPARDTGGAVRGGGAGGYAGEGRREGSAFDFQTDQVRGGGNGANRVGHFVWRKCRARTTPILNPFPASHFWALSCMFGKSPSNDGRRVRVEVRKSSPPPQPSSSVLCVVVSGVFLASTGIPPPAAVGCHQQYRGGTHRRGRGHHGPSPACVPRARPAFPCCAQSRSVERPHGVWGVPCGVALGSVAGGRGRGGWVRSPGQEALFFHT